eukprot:TRINITY_DN26167_c0_g1_i1.p1 TRINITY_DN26167_c0_g1~~TRINITY_DN26167_c0_g1_i1.p1  ORF type:complete len:136 (-),score=38.18 TRINITY_DN26167_c0_g1_i1:27-434(-)
MCIRDRAKIEREGKHISIFAFSKAVGISLAAAEELAKEGIEAEVINLRTVRPLDREAIIKSIKKTSRCITVDESFPVCNIGAEIAATIMESEAFDYLDCLLYTSDAADEEDSVDLGGRRIIKKKKSRAETKMVQR